MSISRIVEHVLLVHLYTQYVPDEIILLTLIIVAIISFHVQIPLTTKNKIPISQRTVNSSHLICATKNTRWNITKSKVRVHHPLSEWVSACTCTGDRESESEWGRYIAVCMSTSETYGWRPRMESNVTVWKSRLCLVETFYSTRQKCIWQWPCDP